MTNKEATEEGYKTGFGPGEKPLNSLGFSGDALGQHYPQRNPQENDPLGEALSIRQVAALLGCSPWTVRQRYLPNGLPHMRSGPLGKLIFYRTQVVLWILEYQRKGGK